MNMNDKYIAALEIGSSKITGAVGVYTPEHTLKVIAVEQEESRDSVRYGIIQNPEEVAQRVTRIIDRLNANPAVAPRKITGVFVGLSGRSMRSIASDVKLVFPEETEFTGELLRRLHDDAMAISIGTNQEILASVPRSYHIDGLETSSPKGAMGKSISAVYDIIIGRSELKRNIQRALSERTGLAIRGMVITAIASADIVLTDEEKRLGCMLVDLGAETTSISIYRKGALCYFAVLPLGGRNITRDLSTLSILEERAEEIKCESGRAIARENPSTLSLSGIKLSDVSNLVVARAEEIIANVVQQITYAGLTEKDLPGGIICIGAGSNLNGIQDLIENQSGLNVRLGHLPAFIQPLDPKSKRHDKIQTAAILYAGARAGKDDCLEIPEVQETQAVEEEVDNTTDIQQEEKPSNDKMKKFFKGISSRFTNMFASPTDDDSELD